ncbi:hypothetical protein Taro_027907 [Colocasia esculenta]|uniref:Uncharacterized protein n=1 Tax=Colocasia esculenta TaxID=4460 RepID=A0A843VVN6_COLES|nr:hypothetical protein [Colocasia esculenta]
MNFDVPYEDMVRGARSGSNSGRRMSSGRASGHFTVPPPLAAGSDQFTPPPPTVAGSGQFMPPPPTVVGASTVPEAEDVVSLQEGGGRFCDGTLREVWINGKLTLIYT